MANEISLVTASGRTVTPKDDGIIYEVFSPGDGIIYGGAVTIKDSSTLHITAGHGIVCGRKFTIDDSDIPVVLSGSGSLLGRLYIHLDLADAADPITLLVETGASLTPEVHDSDVNINNGVYDINLVTFDVDTVTISNLVDVTPKVVGGGSSADKISYDNSASGMKAENVQAAIDELNAEIGSICTFTQYTLLDTINYSTSGSVSYIIPSIEEYKFLCFRFKYDDTTDVYYSFSKAELFLGTHRQLMVDNGRISVELVDNTHIKIWGEDTFKICKLYGVK